MLDALHTVGFRTGKIERDMASAGESVVAEQPGVHFASKDEEIAPEQSLHGIETVTGLGNKRDDLNPEAEKELQQLRTTLQNNIQSSRMQHHAFEPMSLPGSQPASRVSALDCLDTNVIY